VKDNSEINSFQMGFIADIVPAPNLVVKTPFDSVGILNSILVGLVISWAKLSL